MRCVGMLLGVAGLSVSALGQTDPLRFDQIPIGRDSGVLQAPGAGMELAYSDVVETPGADWIRLWFGETVLPEGAELVVTSARDGAHQVLNAQTLAQWSNSSAYFVGDAVFVDLYVPAGAGEARVVVASADAGLPPLAPRTICGGTDDRKLSNDPRAARLAPQGCTAWLFNNRPNSAATADHCGPAGGDALWFNVPLRTSGGSTVPPAPEHQYPVDNASIQDVGASSIGNDWAVFGVFNNSNTGLSPVDAQKRTYVLATQAPPNDGRAINITGYGSTSFPIPSSWYGVQKSHTGTLWTITGTTLRYQTDTTGGNSGSCVYDALENRAIGVHTHGGCGTSSTSSNQGTSINNTGWRTALMQPRGMAAGPIPAVIHMLEEGPERIDPLGGTTIGVELEADFLGAAPQQGVTLHTNDGSGWVETAMASGFAGDWFANFPATDCGATVRYYFSAAGADGTPVNFPPSAPQVTFETISSDAWNLLVDLDFQTEDGWTVSDSGVTAGSWERGVPPSTDRRGGPNEDADGSGSCWTTGVGLNVDLDGGRTRLLSPSYDLSDAVDPWVDVSVWLNADGSSEKLDIEFSDDGGATWALVEARGTTPGWQPLSFRVADAVDLTDAFRVRFSVNDDLFDDVIEAGVDAFRIRDVSCPDLACNAADIAAPFGVLDLADIQAFVFGFNAQDPVADLAKPFGVWDLGDAQAFIGAFESGCR